MTSGIFPFIMSAEPEPDFPVRHQRMRPVASLLVNRSSASPIPPSLQAKMLAVRPPHAPPATLLTLHSTPPRPSPCLLPSTTQPLLSSAPPSPQIPSRTLSPFPRALRPRAYLPLSVADASGPVSPSMTSHPAVPPAQVPAAQKAQG